MLRVCVCERARACACVRVLVVAARDVRGAVAVRDLSRISPCVLEVERGAFGVW